MARIKWCIERQKSKTLYKKMVNRTNETVGPAKGLVADDATETFYLRAKNLELAKKLSDMQLQNATLTRDGELLRTALFNEKVRANTYVNKLNDVTNDCRTALAHIVALSNTLTNILSKLSNNNNYASPMLENKNISPLKQKTKAVKPMVSGCTISKPTIKLNRISEQLLQAAVNGESRLEEQSRVHENRIEPVVNIRRLPERLNLEMLRQDMENIEDEEEERIESESERLDPNGLPQTLSTVMENTEDSSNIRNQTTLQQNVTEHSFSIENSTMSRFTSTPRQRNHTVYDSEPSTSTTPSRRSIFITNRPRKQKPTQQISPKTARRSSTEGRQFSPRNPKVVLRRLKRNERSDVKEEYTTTSKRTRRAAAVNINYKEIPLNRKIRRQK